MLSNLYYNRLLNDLMIYLEFEFIYKCMYWKINVELFRGIMLLLDVKKYFLNFYKKNFFSCNESDFNLILVLIIIVIFVERLFIEIIVK